MFTSDKLIDDTIAAFRKSYGVEMSREEARESIVNLCGFFKTLDKIDREQRSVQISESETMSSTSPSQ